MLDEFYSNRFLLNVYEECKDSFIYGIINNSLKSVVEMGENDSFLYKQSKAVKNSIEQTQFTILYSTYAYILDLYHGWYRKVFQGSYNQVSWFSKEFSDGIKDAIALFLTSYSFGRRNGKRFAIKNGLVSLFIHIVKGMTQNNKLLSKLLF